MHGHATHRECFLKDLNLLCETCLLSCQAQAFDSSMGSVAQRVHSLTSCIR